MSGKLNDALMTVFYKLDAEGTDYAVENGYADSDVVEKAYPDYKKAKNELKAALIKFSEIAERIRAEHGIEYS